MRAVLTALLIAAGFAWASLASAAEPGFRDGLHAYNASDYDTAHAIWLRLAERDDARAQASLGYMYYAGQGVAQDSRRAAEWFQRAANQGESTAQLFLALMHLHADGVSASPELSLMWCELAMAGGQPTAYEWRGRIMEGMTEAQRREASRLVAEWYRLHRKSETR